MYTLGRSLQAMGLVALPVALFWGVSTGGDRKVLMLELAVMAGGALLFLVGRAIEKRA